MAKHMSLSDRISASPGGEHLRRCYACGTCVSVCMIQDRLDENYNPRRLLKMAALDLTDDVFDDVSVWLCTACDLCYRACPQQVHVSRVIKAIRSLAVAAGRKSPLKPAAVNALNCVACGVCVATCPYGAVALTEVKVLDQIKSIARVDPDACMACGLCAALCRSNAIDLQEAYSNEAIMTEIIDF